MELEITTTIYINVEDIIEEHNLTHDSKELQIRKAVKEYISGLDDCEFYLIGSAEVEKIIEEINNRLHAEPTTQDWEDFWNNL